jgi:hypothetical protein
MPVGVPVLGATGTTVAVKVTGWPKTEAFAEELTVIVVSEVLPISARKAVV